MIIKNEPAQKLVFVIDEHGRTLTKKSLHKLLSELFDKALQESEVDAIAVNGQKINNCEYLADQIAGRDISDWSVIYLHDGKYPPVLLSDDDKMNLAAWLPDFDGTSAEIIFKVLTDAGAFNKFD